MSRKWYTIEDLLPRASRVREASYRGLPAREGQLVGTSLVSDRVKVAFGSPEWQWADPRLLDYWVNDEWVCGQYALTARDGKTIMYRIEDPDDPDVGWIVYPTRDEASRAFEDLLEALDVGAPITWCISAVEMTPEEFDALPELDR